MADRTPMTPAEARSKAGWFDKDPVLSAVVDEYVGLFDLAQELAGEIDSWDDLCIDLRGQVEDLESRIVDLENRVTELGE